MTRATRIGRVIVRSGAGKFAVSATSRCIAHGRRVSKKKGLLLFAGETGEMGQALFEREEAATSGRRRRRLRGPQPHATDIEVLLKGPQTGLPAPLDAEGVEPLPTPRMMAASGDVWASLKSTSRSPRASGSSAKLNSSTVS
jgi:hypothetical protein